MQIERRGVLPAITCRFVKAFSPPLVKRWLLQGMPQGLDHDQGKVVTHERLNEGRILDAVSSRAAAVTENQTNDHNGDWGSIVAEASARTVGLLGSTEDVNPPTMSAI